MSDTVVRLTFPAKADYLLLARLALAGLARTAAVGPELLADLKLAVTEACGNVVRHAYAAGEGTVEIEFVLAEDRLDMIVEDRGTGIELEVDELTLGEPVAADAVEAADGGMGIAIIRSIVDDLDIHGGPDGRGTVIRMTKYLADTSE